MKFSCSQQSLAAAIQTLQKAFTKNPSPPYIYIEVCQKTVKFISDGSEQTVIMNIPCDAQKEGSVAAPLFLLRDIITKMPDVILTVDVNEKSVMTVSYIHMKYSIQCISSSSRSYTEDIEEDFRFSMKSSDFKSCIRQTYFAAAQSSSRPVLSGILIKCVNGLADFVSCDGVRVAIKNAKINQDISFEIIIPAKFVFDIIHSNNTYDDLETIITFNSRYIKIKTGDVTLITGLIQGKFINYASVIPSGAGTTMICERKEFLDILERAFLLSDESLNTVKFDITYSKLYVSSASEAGQGSEEVYVKTDGNPITTAFNCKSFIEILRNLEYDLLKFEFTAETRICKITPAEHSGLLYLISPIKV